MFFTKFKELCSKMNTTPTAVVKELGYSTNKVTAWKHGSIPNLEVAAKIAQYFNVSTDYLLTGEEKAHTNTFNNHAVNGTIVQGNNANNGTLTVNGGQHTLSAETLELIRVFDSLDVKGRHKLLDVAFKLEEEKNN